MDEAEVQALIRSELRILVGSMAEAADWYTASYDNHTESAARLVKDVAGRMASDLEAEPDPLDGLAARVMAIDPAEFSSVQLSGRLSVSDPEPVNPFAPKRTPQQWADAIKSLIAEAKSDGTKVWFGGHSESGYLALVIGSGADASPVFEETE